MSRLEEGIRKTYEWIEGEALKAKRAMLSTVA